MHVFYSFTHEKAMESRIIQYNEPDLKICNILNLIFFVNECKFKLYFGIKNM